MSVLLTLGAQSSGLPLGANPISNPLTWIGDSFVIYLQAMHSGAGFARLTKSLVPIANSPPTPGKGHGSVLARTVSQCTLGAGGTHCVLAPEPIPRDLIMIGWVILALVLLARIVRLAARGELRTPQQIVLDLGPRMIAGPLAMQAASPAMREAIGLATWVASLVSSLFLSVANVSSSGELGQRVEGVVSLNLIAAPLLATESFLFYLQLFATIGLILLGLVAPLLIPLALYGDHGRIATAWFRTITTFLMILVVAPVGVAMSVAVMLLFNRLLGLGGVGDGPIAGEVGLLATALACFVLAKNAFAQTRDSFRLTLEGVHLDGVGDLPGQMVNEVRNGIRVGAQATQGTLKMAMGDMTGAFDLAAAAGRAKQALTKPAPPTSPSNPEPPGTESPGADVPDGTPGAEDEHEARAPQESKGRGPSSDGLADPRFLRFCEHRILMQTGREVRLTGPDDTIQGRGGSPRVSRKQLEEWYAEFLADSPATHDPAPASAAA